MDRAQFDFLKMLVETPSPSGSEQQAATVWRKYVGTYADSISTDNQGNVIAAINPGGAPRVMLSGHIDEIGFIIRYIDDKGYLYFGTIGGFDPLTLPGERVQLLGKQGLVRGVIGRKARHLQAPDEQKKGLEIEDLWIDIGVANRDAALGLIDVGTAGSRAQGLETLADGDLIVSRALDNKAGAYVVARALELAKARQPKAAIFAVATVQEEVGLRGARTSAFGIDPQVGLAVDVTHAADYPTADPKRSGDIKLGAGPVVTFGPTINPRVADLLLAAGRARGINIQREAEGRSTGTDADALQQVRGGIATGLISIALRYMHTGAEIGSLNDIERSAELLAETAAGIGPETNVIP
ncbi:MAG TPA: M42 family peptidase [Chloroflexota bacterium]